MNKIKQIVQRGGWLAAPWLFLRSAARLCGRMTRLYTFRYIHGVEVGPGVFLGPRIDLVHPRNIHISAGSSLAAGVSLWSESEHGRLVLGPGAQVNRNAHLDFSGGLTLERNALVSAEAIIYTHDHGRDPRSAPTLSELVIREGAWVGARAIILPSVNYIGTGAVIGAGAVVAQDVPDGATYVGARGRLLEQSRASDSTG